MVPILITPAGSGGAVNTSDGTPSIILIVPFLSKIILSVRV